MYKRSLLALMMVCLAVWGACSSEPESTAEPVAEVEQAALGASCMTDANCNAANHEKCVSGTCQCNYPPYVQCGSACYDLSTDHDHCDSCSFACQAQEVCYAGVCECDHYFDGHNYHEAPHDGGMCGHDCRDFTLDPNCGACNVDCSGGKTCQNEACACPAGQTDCSGTCADLQTDEGHCGSCSIACSGGQTCVAGTCYPSCSTNHDCGFHMLCEGGGCKGHCADNTGCGDDQLCVSSTCQTITAVGATQAIRDQYCIDNYDAGKTTSTGWEMKSCLVGSSNLCVQTAANLSHNNGACTAPTSCGSVNSDVQRMSSFGGAHYSNASCDANHDWAVANCKSLGQAPLSTCPYKMCPSPAEGSTCLNWW